MRVATFGAGVFLAFAPALARADGDGIYGRLRGDVVLSAEAGGGGLWAGEGVRPGLGFALRARYLDTVGPVVGYDLALVAPRYDVLWAGVDFRPAMLARISYDLEQGPRWLDLAVDSLGVDLGVAWLRPGGAVGAGSGLGMVLGTGIELPLAWRRGAGVMLRVAGRWFASAAWDAQGPGPGGGAVELAVGLVVRTIARGGAVGVHD